MNSCVEIFCSGSLHTSPLQQEESIWVYILSKENYSKYMLFLFIDCLKYAQFLIDFSFASLVFSLYASFLLFLSCLVFIDLASTLSHFTLSYKELAITVHILLTLITVHLQHRLSTSWFNSWTVIHALTLILCDKLFFIHFNHCK